MSGFNYFNVLVINLLERITFFLRISHAHTHTHTSIVFFFEKNICKHQDSNRNKSARNIDGDDNKEKQQQQQQNVRGYHTSFGLV
jgi:hypothetical protein